MTWRLWWNILGGASHCVSSVLTDPWNVLAVLCFAVVFRILCIRLFSFLFWGPLGFTAGCFILFSWGMRPELFSQFWLGCSGTSRVTGSQQDSHTLSEPAMKHMQISSVESSGHSISAWLSPCNDNFVNWWGCKALGSSQVMNIGCTSLQISTQGSPACAGSELWLKPFSKSAWFRFLCLSAGAF